MFPSKAGNVKCEVSFLKMGWKTFKICRGRLAERNPFGGKKPPWHWRWQTPGPGWRRKSPGHSPGKRQNAPRLSGSRHGRPARHPQRRVISRPPPKPGGFVINTLGSKRSAAEGKRSRNYPTKPIHSLTVPRTTSLTDAKHSPVDSQSRLQLPGGNAAVGAGLSQNAVQRRPHPSSFLRSSYFSPWRHAGGPEVGCWRDPKPTTCSVRRWEGAGAGRRGRMGGRRGGRREEGRGGEGK